MSTICPFYNNHACPLKDQVQLPEFKLLHDCGGAVSNCSFFVKERLKQNKSDSKIKIFIKKVDNVFLVKADGLIYPTNNLLQIDDPLLNKMTLGQAQGKCNTFLKESVTMGYPYGFPIPAPWKIKQKYFINAVVAGASRLVNEADVSSAMCKSLLYADGLGLESVLILPCDNGTHDISLTSLHQLAAIYKIIKRGEFNNLKHIFICMNDEESEQTFIEYYNRIFGSNNEPGNKNDSPIGA